jgi:PAS domain S-box-containing protein
VTIYRALLASESTELCTEITVCLGGYQQGAEVIQVSSAEAFSEAYIKHSFQVVLYDACFSGLSLSQTLKQVRQGLEHSAVYVIFDSLDEGGIASAIHQGATSFCLRSNLQALIPQLQAFPAFYPIQEPDNVNLQQVLKGFLEESTDSIWVKNKNGKYLLINPAGARFLSKSADNIIGKTDYELFPETTADKITRSDLGVMRTGITQTIEDLLTTYDGRQRTFLAVKGVWRNEREEVAGVIGTVRDISDRKKTEETLRESEERFRLLVEGVKDHAIYLLDSVGLVSSWNIGAERLQGFPADEILGCHFSRFYRQDEEQDIRPEEALLLAIKNGCHIQECVQVRKDGSQYWASIIITPLYNAQTSLIGFSTVVRDMTEQRQAEEALKHYATKLEQSNWDLEQFATTASHDLQAPLRKVRLFSQMLEQHTEEEGKAIAQRLQAAAEKMQHFVTDLLELSRINRKGRPFQTVDLSQVLARVKEDLELIIAETNATIITEQLDLVFGDQPQLEQLLLNLLSNSLKFRRPDTNPVIKVKGESLNNGFYQLTIQDNGIGFKEEYLEKIFLPFERLHGTSAFPGTGMGLAICKKIIDRHGGKITARSAEGIGSTFILLLPLGAEQNQEAPLQMLT